MVKMSMALHRVVLHAVLCQLLVAGAGTAVVGVGVYGDAASGLDEMSGDGESFLLVHGRSRGGGNDTGKSRYQ